MMRISLAVPQVFEDESLDTVAAAIAAAAEIGYEAVEPMVRDPAKVDTAALDSILQRENMRISGFRTGTIYSMDGLSLGDADPSVRERAVRRLKDAVTLCSRYPGAKVLNGLMQGPPAGNERIPDKVALITDSLRRVLEAAEVPGVGVCLEPVNRYELPYNNTVDSVRSIIDEIGSAYLQILIDTFHMNIEERDIYAAIRDNARYIGAVHCADSNRRAPGTGHLDFSRIVGCLRETGYDGYLTVEMPGKTEEFNRPAYEKMHACMKEQV